MLCGCAQDTCNQPVCRRGVTTGILMPRTELDSKHKYAGSHVFVIYRICNIHLYRFYGIYILVSTPLYDVARFPLTLGEYPGPTGTSLIVCQAIRKGFFVYAILCRLGAIPLIFHGSIACLSHVPGPPLQPLVTP